MASFFYDPLLLMGNAKNKRRLNSQKKSALPWLLALALTQQKKSALPRLLALTLALALALALVFALALAHALALARTAVALALALALALAPALALALASALALAPALEPALSTSTRMHMRVETALCMWRCYSCSKYFIIKPGSSRSRRQRCVECKAKFKARKMHPRVYKIKRN